MAVQWHIPLFHKQIPHDNQEEVPKCGICFAEVIKLGASA